MPVLVSPQKLYGIMEVLTRGKEAGNSPAVHAELLSIAIKKEFRGKGYAEGLYAELTNIFHSKGTGRFKIMVGESLVPANKFYKKMGARPVATMTMHKGRKSILYVHEIR
jgi:ribosomal protein S18 acetylase RimI-like enzyme